LRLNPNPDANEICHDKPKKQMAIHPKDRRRKPMGRADYSDDISDWHRMTDDKLVRYNEQVERSGVSKINSLRLLRLYICLCLAALTVL